MNSLHKTYPILLIDLHTYTQSYHNEKRTKCSSHFSTIRFTEDVKWHILIVHTANYIYCTGHLSISSLMYIRSLSNFPPSKSYTVHRIFVDQNTSCVAITAIAKAYKCKFYKLGTISAEMSTDQQLYNYFS